MFAVVRSGGKQYRVEQGRPVTLDRLPGDAGESIELSDVLAMGEGDELTLGAPAIAGARVLATIAEQGRSKKVIVFRYKAKTRARKKNGHRQHFTRVVIDEILAPGQEPAVKQQAEPGAASEAIAEPEAAPKRRRSRKSEADQEPDNAPIAEAALEPDEASASVEDTVETEAVEEAAQAQPEPEEKPKRSRKKAE